jgi:multidrug efflux pump subunit AcrA (membrane-fusion protein)
MTTKTLGRARIAPALLVFAASCGLWLSACGKNEAEVKPVVTVQTAVVQKGDIVQTVETEATLFPIQQAAITPKISAPVSRFFVNRGQKVRKGQLLARLENRDLAAAELENKGGFEQAEATYSSATKASLPEEWKRAELDVTAARQALDAEQKLYDSREELYKQGALPRKELDAARVALTQARNQYEIAQQHLNVLRAVGKKDQLKSASGQLAAAQGKYLGAKALLSYSEIRSPFTGWIADRPLYQGETASAGTPLITVIDNSQIIAKGHIPQEQAALLKVGDSASLTVAGIDRTFSGKVTVVSPAVDPNSTTVEIWAEAANPRQLLRAGTSAHLSIEARKVLGAIIVPTEAIVNAGEGAPAVFVVKDNIAHQTSIRVGIQQGKQSQILDGVPPGVTVVTIGAYGLPDGAEIKLQSAESNDKNDSHGKKDD